LGVVIHFFPLYCPSKTWRAYSDVIADASLSSSPLSSMTPPPLSLPASSADSIPSGGFPLAMPRLQHTLPLTQVLTAHASASCTTSRTTPQAIQRRRSVPPCAQLQRPLRPPYTPARPESQHCSGASPDASQRRGAPHLAKRVEGTVGRGGIRASDSVVRRSWSHDRFAASRSFP
ncbi:hypothetical protein C8R43DRAFT_977509, partial [Mycena crocata]